MKDNKAGKMLDIKEILEEHDNRWADNKMKFYVSIHDIMGALAKNAVNFSPYPVPDNLEIALQKAYTILLDYFDVKQHQWGGKEIGYKEMKDFFLNGMIAKIPECLLWNDRKSGKEGMGFSSRHFHPVPDDDFISLKALARTMANDILFSQYKSHSIPEILSGNAEKAH